jgi:hypothetical protein
MLNSLCHGIRLQLAYEIAVRDVVAKTSHLDYIRLLRPGSPSVHLKIGNDENR